MPLDESRPFEPGPHTQTDYVREVWRLVTEEVLPRLDATNGRVRVVERFMWGLLGGLAVVAGIVVPECLSHVAGP